MPVAMAANLTQTLKEFKKQGVFVLGLDGGGETELRGLEPYGWATIISPRTAIEVRVLVTERVRPVTAGGQQVHQIGSRQ